MLKVEELQELGPDFLKRGHFADGELALFRRSFGPLKCCHPQISDLGFIISWWQLSCEIFLQILTSLELHSNSANRPGILLSHDGSLEVNLLMIFLELSLKKTSRMTKSDIWGWQHLRLPKYLLDIWASCSLRTTINSITSRPSTAAFSWCMGRGIRRLVRTRS